MIFVINTNTLAVTEYSLSALDVVEHQGEVYFVRSDGLAKLGTSGAVSSVITTGEIEALGGKEFNIPVVSIGVEGDGTLTLHTVTKERGTSYTNDTYSLDVTTAIDQHEMMLETRQAARSYQFVVTMDEAGTKLSSFDAYINPVRHRKV